MRSPSRRNVVSSEIAASTPRASPKSVTTTRPSRAAQHVVRLEVAMHEPGGVRGGEPAAGRDERRVISRALRGVARSQSASVSPSISSIATKSRPPAVPTSCTVTTLRMREPRHRARFAQQPLARIVAAVAAAQHLQRDAALEIGIERRVDDAHPAGAEPALEAIATEMSPIGAVGPLDAEPGAVAVCASSSPPACQLPPSASRGYTGCYTDAVTTSHAGYHLTPLTTNRVNALAAQFTPEERKVILHQGTEPAFCGLLLDNKQAGTYVCRLCGLPLFASNAKFESGPAGRASSARSIPIT